MITDNDRAWLAGGIALGSVTVLAVASWVGAAAGAVITGAPAAPLTYDTVVSMTGAWGEVWAQSQTASAVGAGLVNLTAITALIWLLRLLFRWLRNAAHLATLYQVRDLAPKRAASTAIRLRRSLREMKPQYVAPADRGVLLGNHLPSNVELRGSDEDTYVALMAPRAGKSTALAIPIAEEAPASLLLTSNKPDVYAATLALRGRAGTTWVLDTQGVAQIERAMWWDMIAEAETVERAKRLVDHFVSQITNETADPFWAYSASDVLVGYMRAAWHAGGTARDVLRWVADPTDRAPMRVLYEHEPVLAEQIESSVNIAEETQSGIYQNARTALSALRDEMVLAWVTPDKHRPEFRPDEFVTSTDTLYLLSKEGGPTSSVVAALTDAVFTAGMEAGERKGGRLPEPMRAVLDEAANICRISDLPDLYSHLGSRGITPFTILQSYRQGVKAWGEVGMDTMWSAATKKIIGAGVDDPKFVSDISTLIGRHYVHTKSYSKSRDGYSYSVGEQREEIKEAAHIRAMRKGTGLLLATGMPVAQIALRPWYEDKTLAYIGPEKAEEEAAITKRAISSYEERKAARRAR